MSSSKCILFLKENRSHITKYQKFVEIYQKFVQNVDKKPFPDIRKFWSKIEIVVHSGENIICPKSLFSRFSVTLGQKYAKFGCKFC